MNVFATTTILLSLSLSLASAQHAWQQPKPMLPRAQLEKITGPITNAKLVEDLNIVWVWGYDANHRPGAHDYLRVRDLMTELLKKVAKVAVDTAYHFPSKEQFDKADLVVMYLHLPQLSTQQYSDFKSYIAGGGGVVALHETAIMRPRSEGKKLAECLGMSWDEGRSQWGAIFEDISIENTHEIFQGFPEKLRIVDEFYWHLNKIDGVRILGRLRTGPPGSSKARLPESRLSKETSPMFWTLEKGKGRVFGTTTGHNTFSYYDPELRIVLFRAMAWAAKVEATPFMPLVFDGITDGNGMVGTADMMRDWKGKLRKPPEGL
ncbi:MAG: type 1 glutamine amidotransferase [Verrucomicrobiales bacterium]|jgi:type 1 glutamine amidotransferase